MAAGSIHLDDQGRVTLDSAGEQRIQDVSGGCSDCCGCPSDCSGLASTYLVDATNLIMHDVFRACSCDCYVDDETITNVGGCQWEGAISAPCDSCAATLSLGWVLNCTSDRWELKCVVGPGLYALFVKVSSTSPVGSYTFDSNVGGSADWFCSMDALAIV